MSNKIRFDVEYRFRFRGRSRRSSWNKVSFQEKLIHDWMLSIVRGIQGMFKTLRIDTEVIDTKKMRLKK